jgi:hypothetical protein
VTKIYYLVDGPYATLDRPLLLGENTKKYLEEHGYTVLTKEEFVKKVKERDTNEEVH